MADLGKILLIDSSSNDLEHVLPFYGYDVTHVYSYVDVFDALDSIQKFDLILLELGLHDTSNWAALKSIRNGTGGFETPIVVISPFKDEQKMIVSLKLGADAYIKKPYSLPVLIANMEAILRRSKYYLQSKKKFHNVTNTQNLTKNALTEREKDVLLLVARGESNKSIAQKLVLSEVTIKSHLNSIFKKLHVTNRTQAVLLALESKLVEK
jgi:DNA-binding NarL/FixJ family response regulator